jgi:ribose 5-phosphate isomerase B
MVANRYKHVRAAVYYGGAPKIITLSREHNDANILSLGARFLTESEAKRAVSLWLKTPFTKKERHLRRIEKF